MGKASPVSHHYRPERGRTNKAPHEPSSALARGTPALAWFQAAKAITMIHQVPGRLDCPATLLPLLQATPVSDQQLAKGAMSSWLYVDPKPDAGIAGVIYPKGCRSGSHFNLKNQSSSSSSSWHLRMVAATTSHHCLPRGAPLPPTTTTHHMDQALPRQSNGNPPAAYASGWAAVTASVRVTIATMAQREVRCSGWARAPQ